MLTNVGYHSSGNEILYNGMTGEQIETEIFMGPNYYMRLMHMVKDKIIYPDFICFKEGEFLIGETKLASANL